MKRLSGKMRLSIFLSIIWIGVLYFFLWAFSVLGFGYSNFEVDFEEGLIFAFFGPVPVIIVWGIWWIVQGFKQDKAE